MPCFKPLDPSKFKVHVLDRPGTEVPCGQCVGCRLERSRQWAVRCMHEASLYDQNSFVTLTFSPEHLPKNLSLDVRHLQLFFKRLRKSVGKVRYYACGEYGSVGQRPHYHSLLFGHDFSDKKLHAQRPGGPIYVSDELQKLWPYGFSSIGDVTFESAAYVARYVMKKVTGKEGPEFYGERRPEFNVMSRRPGIGAEWLKNFFSDVYPKDRVLVRGKSCRPPRFYDGILEKQDPALLERLKARRVAQGEHFVEDVFANGQKLLLSDSSRGRLRVKEEVKRAEIKALMRPLEE